MEESNRMSRSAWRMIARLRRMGVRNGGAGRDAGCRIAGVSACADFSFLRGVSSAMMPLWGLVRITSCPDVCMQKSVDVCICCRPTNRGFSHCPIKVGRQRAEATLIYAIAASGRVPRETSYRMARNYISTGIYRCSTLDFDMKFCENSCSSRISADKRFS